jgi:membrane-bound ClpP family serine protease
MIKLTQDQIQFIDNYLKTSDVMFDDIRLEMVDHVATAIETEMIEDEDKQFYDVFKSFMVKHKKELLDSNKKFIKKSALKVARHMLNILVSTQGVFILLTTVSIVFLMYAFLDPKYFYYAFGLAPIIVILIAMFGIKVYRVNRKPLKFSALYQLGFYALAFIQIYNVIFNPLVLFKNDNLSFGGASIIVLSLLLFTALVFMLTAFQLSKSYAQKYRFIIGQ